MSSTKELRALVAGVDAAKPDSKAIAGLRSFLKDNPDLWRNVGDLAEQANLSMIDHMNAPTAMKESMFFGLSAMTAELAQPGDGALETMIIRQIVGSWLRLSFVEYALSRGTADGSLNMAQGAYWEKRVTTAQRRYLRAIETLARVRRLRLPAVQVNIGAQQVNTVT